MLLLKTNLKVAYIYETDTRTFAYNFAEYSFDYRRV